jgi:aminoglycoside 6'-N-acetyltransferase
MRKCKDTHSKIASIRSDLTVGANGALAAADPCVSGDYEFRPVIAADLAMLARWLRTPEVMKWWGEPDEELVLLQDDLDDPRMVMRIVSLRGRAFAYAQHYDVHAWPQAHLALLPAGSRAIDSFIGEPELLGCGHGSRYLKALAAQLLLDGAPYVAIDPDVENRRARRAYANAGFREAAAVTTDQGPAMLMLLDARARA